jgi:hypothetical protein
MADLRKRARIPFDFIRISLPAFQDMWLKLKTTITKENFTGIYIGICNKSEVNMYFKNCVAGGYTGYVQIKLFAQPNCEDYEECAEDIINHEVLHQVLEKVGGIEAKKALDKIHKSFYVYDVTEKKWRFVIKFVHEKNSTTKTIEII